MIHQVLIGFLPLLLVPLLLLLRDSLKTHRRSTHRTGGLTLLKPVLRTFIAKVVTTCEFTTRFTFVTYWTLHGLYRSIYSYTDSPLW